MKRARTLPSDMASAAIGVTDGRADARRRFVPRTHEGGKARDDVALVEPWPPAPPEARGAPATDPSAADAAAREAAFVRIFAVLRRATGVDFAQYKRATIDRRVHRQMVRHRLTDVAQYARHLEEHRGDVRALFEDLLIPATAFFRDPESFEVLRRDILPRIVRRHGHGDPIRVWSAGCSTGEEAYSIAIAFLECAGGIPITVFATDVSDVALERARAGVYRAGIEAHVSRPRLERFFTREDGGYRIRKSVRDVCVFARHDLTRDPPYSRLDLVLCRNVLMYMGVGLQQRVVAALEYALRPGGFLMLGRAETIRDGRRALAVVHPRHGIYVKDTEHAATVAPAPREPTTIRRHGTDALARHHHRTVVEEADRVVAERYAPPGLVVDAGLGIVRVFGRAAAYLGVSPDDPHASLLDAAQSGLAARVRAAVDAARKTNAPVLRAPPRGRRREPTIEVLPLAAARGRHLLVLFHEERRRGGGENVSRGGAPRARARL